MKKILAICFAVLFSPICFAQEQVAMADEIRSSGKIYIVVSVLITIFLGIILYLILIDRKLSDIEKRINKK